MQADRLGQEISDNVNETASVLVLLKGHAVEAVIKLKQELESVSAWSRYEH